MSCCNFTRDTINVVIEELQYRKRYELLQHLKRKFHLFMENSLVTIPQAVWAVATNDFNGKPANAAVVTIPQAVWAVATVVLRNTEATEVQVTIPQAVWAVATSVEVSANTQFEISYNTASGMSCCNNLEWILRLLKEQLVTIPQAVWAVATDYFYQLLLLLFLLQYRKRYELLQRENMILLRQRC